MDKQAYKKLFGKRKFKNDNTNVNLQAVPDDWQDVERYNFVSEYSGRPSQSFLQFSPLLDQLIEQPNFGKFYEGLTLEQQEDLKLSRFEETYKSLDDYSDFVGKYVKEAMELKRDREIVDNV